MSETLKALIQAASARRYLDMLPVLVCCDCMEEEGYAGESAVVRLRYYAERVVEAANVPQVSSSKRIQLWNDNDEVDCVLREFVTANYR